jgi:hypothetical protein
MWWLWPHFKRLWAAAGRIAAGLIVNYLFAIWGNQSVPDLQRLSRFLLGYWYLTGGTLTVFAAVSIVAARAHRRRETPHFIGESHARKGETIPPLQAPTNAAVKSGAAACETGQAR